MNFLVRLPLDITHSFLATWLCCNDMEQLQTALGDSHQSTALNELLRKITKKVKGCDFRKVHTTANIHGLEQVILLFDGRVAYYDGKVIHVWNPAESSSRIDLIIESSSIVTRIYQHKSTGYLLSTSFEEDLFVWDVTTGACVFTLSSVGDVCVICDLSDDCRIAVLVDDEQVLIVNLKTFQKERSLVVSEGRGTIAPLSDGRLATASSLGTFLWDLSSPDTQRTEIIVDTGDAYCYSLLQLPDGKLVCGKTNGFIQLWDLSSLTCLQEIKVYNSIVGRLTFFKFHQSDVDFGCVLSIELLSRRVKFLQYFQSAALIELTPPVPIEDRFGISTFSLSDGRVALVTLSEIYVIIMNPSTNEIVRRLSSERASGVLQLPDGRLITYRMDQKTISVWEPYF